jgi:4-hydroxy-tetrahydrodipicolinate reductase
MIRVVVAGASGRMGGHIIRMLHGEEGMELAGATERPGFPAGLDAAAAAGLPPAGVPLDADLEAALARGADVLVDFTSHEASSENAATCARRGVAHVIGSTGFDARTRARVREAATKVPVVLSPNMSVGVNVLFALVREAARTLGDAYDVEVVEMHHRHKVDAPSGTALLLGEAAAKGLGRDLKADGVFGRHGVTGERRRGSIGFASLRGGDVVGDHSVVFAGAGERVELAHKAGSRLNFAQGALRAARFVASKRSAGTKGMFDMQDVLGLR